MSTCYKWQITWRRWSWIWNLERSFLLFDVLSASLQYPLDDPPTRGQEGGRTMRCGRRGWWAGRWWRQRRLSCQWRRWSRWRYGRHSRRWRNGFGAIGVVHRRLCIGQLIHRDHLKSVVEVGPVMPKLLIEKQMTTLMELVVFHCRFGCCSHRRRRRRRRRHRRCRWQRQTEREREIEWERERERERGGCEVLRSCNRGPQKIWWRIKEWVRSRSTWM